VRLKQLRIDEPGADTALYTLAPLSFEEFQLTDWWIGDSKREYQAWCRHHGFKALTSFHHQELKDAKIVLIEDPGTKLYYTHDRGETWNLIESWSPVTAA
jgi:hypothetical protein